MILTSKILKGFLVRNTWERILSLKNLMKSHLPCKIIKLMIDPALFSGSDYTFNNDKVPRLDRDRDSSSFPFFLCSRPFPSRAILLNLCVSAMFFWRDTEKRFTLQLNDNLLDWIEFSRRKIVPEVVLFRNVRNFYLATWNKNTERSKTHKPTKKRKKEKKTSLILKYAFS